MKKSLLGLILTSLILLNTQVVLAADPGCYAQRGPGPQEIDCNEIRAFHPTFSPDPVKCYISEGMNGDVDGFGQPTEFPCANNPAPVFNPSSQSAATVDKTKIRVSDDTGNPDWACGGGDGFKSVNPAFDIGCKGQGNPIIDMLFAFIRVLTTGVGFALIISIIIAGIQYTTAGGDPNKTAQAKNRLVSTLLVALPIYLLTYAILNWLVPGMVL